MNEGLRYKIALVDDNVTNLVIGRNMLKHTYEVFPVNSGEKLLALLEKILPDLILLDIAMPGMDGYETLNRLQGSARFKNIPVIFLTAKADENSEIEGLNLGAVDYVSKPFRAPLLIKRIENHILLSEQRKKLQYYNDHLQDEVRKKAKQVLRLQKTMLSTVTELVEFRDGNTGGHIDRTQRYVELLIIALIEQGVYPKITEGWDIDLLVTSTPLHDAGKIAISDAILNKPGKLTVEEFEIMKLHVDFGVEAIEHIEQNSCDFEFLKYAKVIAGTHHEKWDGGGYPYGLAGEDIPLEGRLMAIADVYDALISKRPYKKAFSTEEAVGIINEGRGTHFDPVLVDVFNKVAPGFALIAKDAERQTSPIRSIAGIATAV